jgi:YD repeat-containing protein
MLLPRGGIVCTQQIPRAFRLIVPLPPVPNRVHLDHIQVAMKFLLHKRGVGIQQLGEVRNFRLHIFPNLGDAPHGKTDAQLVDAAYSYPQFKTDVQVALELKFGKTGVRQMIALIDSDFVYFDRISKGTGYTDAVYQHTETSTRFYKATQAWNGNGWTTRFADGSEIRFPESYNAKNSAQGAPTEMRDAKGNRLELSRDPQRNLQQIKTPNGHWISFISWSSVVRVSGITS